MPNLIDPACKPAPPSKPKPAFRQRQISNIRDGLREQETEELNYINKPANNDGRISHEAESNNNSINGLPQETQVNAEKPKNELNRPKPVPRERKPVPLPKVRKPVELPCDSEDGQLTVVNSQSPESRTSDKFGPDFYSQVSKAKNTSGSSPADRRLGISTSLGIPTIGEPQSEPKSPTQDASSPPPKPPRGVPYKGPSQIQHSFTYTQGAALGKGGSLGRDYQRHLPPASWKSKLQEVEEGGAQDERPRALSDVDLNPEQIKIRDRNRPEPPPKALKPKLERQKSEEPEEPPCNAERDDNPAECTDGASLYEEVPEFDDDAMDNIYETIGTEAPTLEESPRNEAKMEKNSPQLGSDVVAALKSNVVLRNKPHLRNRKEVRQSAPIGLDSDKGSFLSHLKDNWKSQSVKRAPDKKHKPWQQSMDVVVEKKELLSKLAGKKKKGEVRKSTSESGEEGIKFTATAPDADEQLFDFVAVVSLRLNDNHEVEPYISFQFPPKLKENNEKDAQIASIPDFCFPDLEDENFVDSNDLGTKRGFRSSETFSFVLTDITGHRNFGYCRHILVKDKTSRGTMKSEVYCIVSPHGLFSLYSQILDEVERQRVYSSSAVFAFLKAVLSKPMPPPGSQVEVPFFSQSADNATETLTLVRGKDSAIHEHVDFRVLFDTLPLKVVLSIVSFLLLEKRVILAACQLSLLSACCHGLIALLYPFSWLHTYIPVLPSRLIDMCCLPTPYLLGILSKCLPALEDLPLDDVVIVDLDAKTVRGSDSSVESSFFPKEIQETIEKELQPVLRSAKREVSDKEESENKDRNAYITEVFVCAYIHMVGHFPDFLTKDPESDEVIQRTNFYRAASTKEQKKFLKKFTDTQAFIYLVKQKINENDVMAGLFEKRLVEWRRTRRIGIDFSQVTSKLKDLLPRLKS